MKQLIRILIYPLLIFLILQISSTKVVIPDIIKPSWQTRTEQVYKSEPPLSGSFVLAAQLDTIPVAAPTLVSTSVGSSIIPNCGDNWYANWIYEEESGCNLDAVNPYSGDYGIGQSGGGLSSSCPDWQTDYTCQNAFFTNYALSRYGSWEAAYNFHLLNGWW